MPFQLLRGEVTGSSGLADPLGIRLHICHATIRTKSAKTAAELLPVQCVRGPGARSHGDDEPCNERGHEPPPDGHPLPVGEDRRQADGQEEDRQGHSLRVLLAEAEQEAQQGDEDDSAADSEDTGEQAGEEARGERQELRDAQVRHDATGRTLGAIPRLKGVEVPTNPGDRK